MGSTVQGDGGSKPGALGSLKIVNFHTGARPLRLQATDPAQPGCVSAGRIHDWVLNELVMGLGSLQR